MVATPEAGKRDLLVKVVAGIADAALGLLHPELILATLVLALVAAGKAFSAGGSVWVVGGVATVFATVSAVFGPLARHWGPLSIWFTMLTAMAVNLGVILLLQPR